MNKNLTYVIVAVVVLGLLGIGAFFLMNKKPLPEQKPIPEQIVEEKPVPTMKSFNDLLTSGTPQKCSYNDATASANISGSSYISAGKIRTDFTTTTDQATSSGHMIVDGKTSYLWVDGQTTGFKMMFDPNSVATPSAKEGQGIDPNKAMNFTCSSWTVDSSVFVLPTGIKFTDVSALTAPKQGINQCAACDALSGDAKDQCKVALKCN